MRSHDLRTSPVPDRRPGLLENVTLRGGTMKTLAVHGDVTALLNAGVLDRTAGGQIVFPYEVVKVEFLLQAA